VSERSEFHPVRVSTRRGGRRCPQAGAVVLPETVRTVGLDRMLSAALAPWRKPLAVHDPAKIICDLAVMLTLGGDCVADRRHAARAVRRRPCAAGQALAGEPSRAGRVHSSTTSPSTRRPAQLPARTALPGRSTTAVRSTSASPAATVRSGTPAPATAPASRFGSASMTRWLAPTAPEPPTPSSKPPTDSTGPWSNAASPGSSPRQPAAPLPRNDQERHLAAPPHRGPEPAPHAHPRTEPPERNLGDGLNSGKQAVLTIAPPPATLGSAEEGEHVVHPQGL